MTRSQSSRRSQSQESVKAPASSSRDGNLPESGRLAPNETVRLYQETVASLERLSATLPNLAVLVTTVDPGRRNEFRRVVAEAMCLSEVERCERRVIQKMRLSPRDRGEVLKTTRKSVELSKKIEGLWARVEEIFGGGKSIPLVPGRLSATDEMVLCKAMTEHRKRFWTALHMVPFIREHALSELDRLREGNLKASRVIFTKRSEKKSEGKLTRHVGANARTVRGMLNREDRKPGLLNSAKIATLLIEVPLLPEKQVLFMEELSVRTSELRSLVDRLTRRYGSVSNSADHTDPDYERYVARTRELGGGIEQAEVQCRVLAALLEPYQRIKDYLVNANIGLVGRVVSSQEPHDDLMQDGILGLMRAIEKYDHETGYKLSTVATWWITQSVRRSRPTYQNPIELPGHQVSTLAMVSKADAQEGSPSHQELAEKLNLEQDVVEALRRRLRGMTSLSSNNHDGVSVGERIEDYRSEPVIDVVRKRELGDRIKSMLARMDHRSAEVLRLRFGLDGEPLTLEEIAGHFKVTRERVRQIQAKAIDKIKSGHLSKMLEDFVE